MAQLPNRTHHTPVPLVTHGDRFAVPGADGTSPGPQQVRSHAVGQVVLLEVTGPLSSVVKELDQRIQLALADGPRGVVCDLSGVPEGVEPDALDMLATAGRHVRDWPGTPVAVASPDPHVRNSLSAGPMGGHLIVSTSALSAVSAVQRIPAPKVEWLRLAPHPTAPRAARNFVTRTLLDWRLGRVISSACLVVSELVTNSAMHAGTDIDLSVAWNRGILRLTVRDGSPWLPHQLHAGLQTHGRGLIIVSGLSRDFGALPTADAGKVVWAVLDASATPLDRPAPVLTRAPRPGRRRPEPLSGPGQCLRTDLRPAPTRPPNMAFRS